MPCYKLSELHLTIGTMWSSLLIYPTLWMLSETSSWVLSNNLALVWPYDPDDDLWLGDDLYFITSEVNSHLETIQSKFLKNSNLLLYILTCQVIKITIYSSRIILKILLHSLMACLSHNLVNLPMKLLLIAPIKIPSLVQVSYPRKTPHWIPNSIWINPVSAAHKSKCILWNFKFCCTITTIPCECENNNDKPLWLKLHIGITHCGYNRKHTIPMCQTLMAMNNKLSLQRPYKTLPNHILHSTGGFWRY